jgi:hypothetical protein
MKINQLFTQPVEGELLIKLLQCYGLKDLQDKRMFSKYDMMQMQTVAQLTALLDELRPFYLPCKAKVYLDDLNEKKALTVLKQVLRLNGHFLSSTEKNIQNKKIIFYKLISEEERAVSTHMMQQMGAENVLTFE